MGDRTTKTPPAPARNKPSVVVCPDCFMTYARASTAVTVHR
jgi:hypothetical protein